MKKFFLAFSILLSFSFSWAQERPANPGNDPIEAMAQDGAGTTAVGVKGVCANCLKNAWHGDRNENTNPAAAQTGSSPSNGGSSTSGEVTK